MLLVLPVPKYIFSKVYLSENPCNKRMSYTYCTRIIDAHTSTSCFGRAEHSSLLFFGMFFKARYYINIALSHTMNLESSYNTFDIEMIIKAHKFLATRMNLDQKSTGQMTSTSLHQYGESFLLFVDLPEMLHLPPKSMKTSHYTATTTNSALLLSLMSLMLRLSLINQSVVA